MSLTANTASSRSIPATAREHLRSLYHLALYVRHLENGPAVWRHRNVPAALPALQFRSGMTWHHSPRDEPLLIMRELYGQKLYQPLDLAPGAHVVDIGANIGAVTMFWAQNKPGVHFHCYEPNPQAFATLERNIAANGLTGQVTLHQEGVSGKSGMIDLWVDVPTAHSTAFGDSPFPGGRRVSALVVSLDEVWLRLGRKRIAMLKIDTEGGEVATLEGASSATLAAVDRAIIEYHDNLVPGAFARCRAVLDKAGFSCSVFEHPWQEGVITATRR